MDISPMHVLIMVLFLAVVIVPVQEILHRTGYSRWWCLLAFVPLVNLVGIWFLAYSRWPAVRANPR